jgi:hypothetical protein
MLTGYYNCVSTPVSYKHKLLETSWIEFRIFVVFTGSLILQRSFAAVHLITISVLKTYSFAEENLLIESNGFENEAVKDENGDLKYEPGDYFENGREEEEKEEGSERIASEEVLEEDTGGKLRGPLPLIRYC